MKKLLDFTPCNLTDIPSKKGNRRMALMKSIRAFYEGEHPAVEVDHKDSYKSPASAVNALSVATKAEGLWGFVRVVQRGDRVFLVRKFAKIKI